MTRLRLLIPLVCSLALCAAPNAFAQQDDDGVFVDPDAPTSKEYAIPLEEARRDAAGGEKELGRQAQGERSAPLFGAGVGEEGRIGSQAQAQEFLHNPKQLLS